MLIQLMQEFALRTRTRVTFLSGDVHCASVGVLKTHVHEKNAHDIDPQLDYRFMLNVVSSTIRVSLGTEKIIYIFTGAIVNTP